MRFRRVREGDAPYIYSWLDKDDYLRQGVFWSALSQGLLYGVEVEGRVEGISILYPVGGIAWLMGARVRKEMRGRGIGEYMTRGLLEEARRMGLRGAALLTSRWNTPVHRICSSLGMERVLELFSASIPPIPYRGILERVELRSLHPESLGNTVKTVERGYPLLPITPGGLVWAPVGHMLRTLYGRALVCRSEGRELALVYSGCSWTLEDRCRSSLAGILLEPGRGGSIWSALSCATDTASDEGVYDVILWSRDSEDIVLALSPIARWSWRSYIYYIDLK